MDLTRRESSVIHLLQHKTIATMSSLCDELDISHMTVVRALNKHGYHSSVNHNAAYYALHQTPRFNEEGLWNYRGVCFSKHGSLAKTLIALTELAPAGLTVSELGQRVNSNVGNLLSRLCREGKLSRGFSGRKAVYLAVDKNRLQQQTQERQRQTIPATEASAAPSQPALGSPDAFPPQDDVVTVLEVLIQVIKTPRSDAAQLAKALRARRVNTNATAVRRILDFYSIQKKRNARGGQLGLATHA